MEQNLTDRELDFIKKIMKSDDTKQERSMLSFLVAFVNIVLGSLLIISTAVFFLNSPTTEHAKWVLLPGSISGIILLLIGLLLSRENSRTAERKKIALILKKVIHEDLLKK
jgi:hypothetical protein